MFSVRIGHLSNRKSGGCDHPLPNGSQESENGSASLPSELLPKPYGEEKTYTSGRAVEPGKNRQDRANSYRVILRGQPLGNQEPHHENERRQKPYRFEEVQQP